MEPPSSPPSQRLGGSPASALAVLEPEKAAPRFLDRYWVGGAATLRRYTLVLSEAWYDGIYLTAWRRVALAAPAVALLFGLVEGVTHWTLFPENGILLGDPVVAFTELLVFMVVVAAVSALSANLGLLLLGGYALGDFLIAGPQATDSTPLSTQRTPLVGWGWVFAHVPQLISYALLLLLVLTPTLTAKYLPARLRMGLPENETQQIWLLRTAARAVVQAAYVYSWTLAAQALIQVFWTWGNSSPPEAATYFLQNQGSWLVFAALAASLLRSWLTRKAFRQETTRKRRRALVAALEAADTRQAPTRRLPSAARVTLTAIILTLLLAGFIAGLLEAVIVCVSISLILIARTTWLPRITWWIKWARQVTRVPIALRLVAVFIAGNVEGMILVGILSQFSFTTTSVSAALLPVLLSVSLGLLTAVVLLPVEKTSKSSVGAEGPKATQSTQTA